MNAALNHMYVEQVQPDGHWKGILECAAIEVFGMMAGSTLTGFPEPPGEVRGDRTAMVGLAGTLCGMITIRCTSFAAAKLADRMLGGDASTNPTVTGDALGELCNMVAGNFKSKVSSLADRCLLSVPTVISGEDYTIQTIPPSDGFQVVLSFEGEALWVSLVIHS